MYYRFWKPYASVAERRRKAEREMQKLGKKGHAVSPVAIEGRTIAGDTENRRAFRTIHSRFPQPGRAAHFSAPG